ncbi:GNAT family N-acetyltransferase [Halobacillus faecis]|uniref:N-acetyltransferase n=1 Tax=Halobacillus faecis TaxID=360184 RepID=A0A511WWT7_9BACI|nr:GNAT family N-acetyltransferase [Halobacillus faecis]GEN53852.1 N-acetyltransferase [Halobacillus faecis]
MENFTVGSETERLIIKPLEIGDFESWLQGFESRLPSKHRYDEGQIDMSECTEEWFGKLVEKHQQLASEDTAYVFGVFLKEDHTHLGMIDFSTLVRYDFQWGRIGYALHNQHWQKGYGKEAVAEALQIAFHPLNYHRVEAHINLDNQSSIKLAESIGLEYECTRKGFIHEFGEWTDNLIYYKNAE